MRFDIARTVVSTLGKTSRRFLRLTPATAVLSLAGFSLSPAAAQNYQTSTGSPSFSAPAPVELGFVDASNGNLHITIPLGTYSQRGASQPQTIALEYDSNIWAVNAGVSAQWMPSNGFYSLSGWYYSFAASGKIQMGLTQGCWTDVTWADQSGTAHSFHLNYAAINNGGCPNSADAFATDSSGYHMYLTGSSANIRIYAPDGTLVNSPWTDSQGRTILAEDSNGNYISLDSGRTLYDTLGRTIFSASCAFYCGNSATVSMPTSQGTAQYSLSFATINVKTNFQQPGVQETTTQIQVIRSLTLPDATNSTYYFTYDCDSSSGNAACGSPGGQSAYYGALTGYTLPTGGKASYYYSIFKDAYGNMNNRVNSYYSGTVGSYSYQPQVLSTCSAGQVNCQQQTTVSSPTGTTVYTFQLNNGAWPTTIVSKDNAGNLLSTVTNTWDFSQSCVLNSCNGASYVRLLTQQTKVPAPGGNLTKQTQYSYDSPQKGNQTAIKEWEYTSSGSFSSVPDRATYITYLTTGTNNINKPLSVTLCNNSGSDSACPGGGTRVSQTQYNYDIYGTNGLTSITGIAQHDDINFGSGYTTRGNVTSVSKWVSGSSYLTTSSTYDTTGQVMTETDTAQNITFYGYSDSFFTDGGNGTTPSAYTPPAPTNAYLTHVTDTIGTQTVGYYWGSGKVSFATDYNGASTYSHYQDGLDRLTEEIDPIGWKLATYSSATQSDIYAAVGDVSPSTTCRSCQHTQTILDSWGRKASQILVNNPIGQVNIDSGYDGAGRLLTETHPYSGASDPNHVYETYGYDSLSRVISITHPDGQASLTAYGANVVGLGGLSTQQGSATSYGYGYPQISQDEAGKQREQWLDGFGRIIEVDEPSTTSGTPASTTVSIQAGPGPQSMMVNPCHPPSDPCPQKIWNQGTVSLTVNGYTATAGYSYDYDAGQFTTAAEVASDLASGFIGDPNSPVTASANGASLLITAKGPGASGNFSFSSSETWYTQYMKGASFSISPASGALSGGSGGIASSPYVTNYIYDAVGNLTKVVQGNQIRTFAYDGLGRKVLESTPEGGTVTYAYVMPGGGLCSGDPSSVCQRTDARGVVSTYAYDHANQLIGVAYTIPGGQNISPMPNVCTTAPNGTAANVCYYYGQGGSAAYGLGRLTGMIDATGSETYNHDADGRVTQLSKVVNGQTYTITYQFDASGNVKQITYPSGRVVQQAYNAIGQLCEIAATASGCGDSTYYAGGLSYNAPGKLTGFTYGNGVAASLAYSAPRAQLSTLAYTKGSSTYFNLQYWYQQNSSNCPNGTTGNNGSIQCITDGVDSGRTAKYGYDSLGRMISAQTNGSTGFPQWGMVESYDRFGNRWNQTATAGTVPQPSLTFGANGMNSSTTNQPNGYTFDASGNMTLEPLAPYNSMTYDGENRMTAFSGIGGAAGYTYDGNGLRVVKSVNGGTTTVSIFAGSSVIAEYDNGALSNAPSREYITGPTGMLAMLSGGATTYYHQDHLSARLTTDANGNILTQEGHYPFGEQWYMIGQANKWFFTSYQRDSESGLDYALARYYDSRTGTFCSADPLAGSPGDPQSWNRYPYGRNDPIDVMDPSGKSWWSALLEIGVGVAAAILPEMEPAWFSWMGGSAAADTASFAPDGISSTMIDGVESSTHMWSSVAVNGTTHSFSIYDGALLGGGVATVTNQPKAPKTPMKNCPPVPPHPKGSNINTNIGKTEDAIAADPSRGKNLAKAWWVNQVKTNGVWDYKTQGMQYDDFGNFNYGATGAVFGFSFGTLEAGAVGARFFKSFPKSALDQLKNNGLANPTHKNDMIRQGMQYRQNNCGHV